MLDYRFYRLSKTGQIQAASNHKHPDDSTALAEAARMLDGQPIEGWQGTRLVFRLNSDGSNAT